MEIFRRSNLPRWLTGGAHPPKAPEDPQVRDWVREARLSKATVEPLARVMEKELARRTGTLDFSAADLDALDRLPPSLLARLADHTRRLALPAGCPDRIAFRLMQHLPRLEEVSPDPFMLLMHRPLPAVPTGSGQGAARQRTGDAATRPSSDTADKVIYDVPPRHVDEVIYDVPPRRVDDGGYKQLPDRPTRERSPLPTGPRPQTPETPPKRGRQVARDAEPTYANDYDLVRSRRRTARGDIDASRQRALLEQKLLTDPSVRTEALRHALAALRPAAAWADEQRGLEAPRSRWSLPPASAKTMSDALIGLPPEAMPPILRRPLMESQRLLALRPHGKPLQLSVGDVEHLIQALRTAQQLTAETLGTSPDLPPPRRARSLASRG